MKRTLRAVLAALLASILVFSFAACTKNGGTTVTITREEATIGVTETVRLNAEAEDSTKITWTSSDDTVATVSNGTVTGVKLGEATITATSESGGKATCKVTVADIKVTLSDTTLTLDREGTATVPKTKKLTATVSGIEDTVVWSSGDRTIADVDGQGNVTAVHEGIANITARRKNGTISASCQVTVVWGNKPAGYEDVEHYEQNKVPTNTWGRWANQAWEGGGTINMNEAEYWDSADSEAGVVALNFTVEAHGTLKGADLQLTYRSAGEDGKFETGAYYSLTADVTSSVAGPITLNGNDFTLEANKKTTITAYFLHEDDGTIYPDGVYDNINFTAVFLLLGNLGEVGETVDFKIENMHWSKFTPAALNAPTVAVADKTATVTDTANEEGTVKDYTIGFFANESAADPKYVINNAVAGANTIQDNRWENGTYVVRVRANGLDARYTDSAWSTGNDVTYEVANEHVEYEVPWTEEANIQGDGWFFWAEGQDGINEDTGVTEARYYDGSLFFNIETSAGNWYSTQLYYRDSATSASKQYTITFTIKASELEEGAENRIRINGTMFTLQEGDNTINVSSRGGNGVTLISIQFGELSGDSTLSAIAKGHFEFCDFSFEEGAVTGDVTLVEGGTAAAVANPGTWTYYAQYADALYAAKYEDGTLTVTVGGGNFDSWQFFFKHSGLTAGKTYTLSFTVEVKDVTFRAEEEAAGTTTVGLITTAGDVRLTPNTPQNVSKSVPEGDASTQSLMFMLGGWRQDWPIAGSPTGGRVVLPDGNADPAWDYGGPTEYTKATFVFTNIKWTDAEGNEFTCDDEMGEIPPTTPAKPEDYNLGDAINATYALQNADKEAYHGREDAEADKFAVWHTAENGWDGCGTIVTMNETKIENDALTISYTGGSVDFSVQLYYNNASVVNGKDYFLSMKINASEGYSITINGVKYRLAQGDNNVALVFTKTGAIQALDVQFPGHDTQLTFVISEVSWREVQTPPPPTSSDFNLGEAINPTQAFEKNGEKEATNDTWAYWFAEDAGWNCGSVVTMSENKIDEDGKITLAYTGGDVDFSVQLFYKNTHLEAGSEYFLFATINVSSDLEIKLNGQIMSLTAGSHNLEVKFAGSETAFSLQLHGVGAESVTVEVSNVTWQKVLGPKTSAAAPQLVNAIVPVNKFEF